MKEISEKFLQNEFCPSFENVSINIIPFKAEREFLTKLIE